jgi:hypothetical protein
MAQETDISLGYVLALTRLPTFCPHKIMTDHEKILTSFNKWYMRVGVWCCITGLMCFDNSEFKSVFKQYIQSLLQKPGS